MKPEHSFKQFTEKLKRRDTMFELLIEAKKINQCLFWIQMTLFALLFVTVLK